MGLKVPLRGFAARSAGVRQKKNAGNKKRQVANQSEARPARIRCRPVVQIGFLGKGHAPAVTTACPEDNRSPGENLKTLVKEASLYYQVPLQLEPLLGDKFTWN